MAAPFIYVPEQAAAAESAAQLKYHNPYFHTPSTGQSPFLPPSPLLYPSSPYLGPKDGGADSNKNKNKPFDPTAPAPWPQSGTAEQPIQNPAYKTSWVPLTARPRTTSWHAPPPGSPSSLPKAPSMLHAQSYLGANAAPAHKRSKSWGVANAPPAPVWAAAANAQNTPDTLPPMQVHPWLNGDSPSPIFFFDLAPTAFAPQRAVTSALASNQNNKMHGVGLSGVEMRETAFHPPLTKCRILHPQLPFWPIDLALPEDLTAAQGQGQQQQPLPPISLGDVLAALHHALHVRIAPADWAALSPSEQANVGGAFTRRCREEAVRALGGEAAGLREREVEERNKGVKRVDFLLGKTVFKGLLRARGDPEGCVRVVTA